MAANRATGNAAVAAAIEALASGAACNAGSRKPRAWIGCIEPFICSKASECNAFYENNFRTTGSNWLREKQKQQEKE